MARFFDPIVEYAAIDYDPNSEEKIQFFHDWGPEERYWGPIVQKLKDTKSGVYLFYDSRGLLLYVGQTKKQTIWQRANCSFQTSRDGSAHIRLVDHPSNNVEYKERHRVSKIRGFPPVLYETARYFSAYTVLPDYVDQVEALLIRANANSLLNIKMEGPNPLSEPLKVADET